MNKRVETVVKATEKRVKEAEKKYLQEKEIKGRAYERMEEMRMEMRALEGRDFTSDLWKEKCKELFVICKDLQEENDSLKLLVSNQYPQN